MSINDKYVEDPPFVGLLQFETSTACNGCCVFCSHKDMTRSGYAAWSTILKIIDEALPYAQTVCPFLMQEPFMEKRLSPILDYMRQVNPKAHSLVYSNMTVLPDWEIIRNQLLDELIISFYGPTPDLYRKYQPCFDWVVTRENIHAVMTFKKALGVSTPFVKMHYIVLPDLLEHSKTFYDEWSQVVDKVGVTIYRTHDEHDTLVQNVDLFEQTVWGPPAMRVPCQRVWSGFYVLFNGDVVPCSADYNGVNVLGNIVEEEPMDVWWSEKTRFFRQKHINKRWNEIEMCTHCNYWKYEQSREWVDYWVTRWS